MPNRCERAITRHRTPFLLVRRAPNARLWPAIALVLFAAPAVANAQDTAMVMGNRGVRFTPVMIAAGETFWRQRNLTADVGSPVNAIPFDGTTNAKTSEYRMTGRQSKIGLLAEAKADRDSLSAYWESDFLLAGTTSNSNENNGYGVRIRQMWGRWAMASHWNLVSGQMWSMMTTNRTGMLPRSEQIPLTIDGQYAVGFNWARQGAIRFLKQGTTSYGIALEGAQTVFSARNTPANVVVGQTGGNQLNNTNNYSTDLSPDLIGKIAFDPKGRGHWEIKAIGRLMRDRIVDPANVAGGSRSLTATAGGVGFSGMMPFTANGRDLVDVGLSGLAGKGIGRYGTGSLADATIGQDGALRPIEAGQLLLTIEAHPTRRLDVYNYDGVEYADRTAFVDGTGKGVGYGSPLNNTAGCMTEAAPAGPFASASGPCNADNRSLWQSTVGFWYRIYRGAGGTFQWGMQYSHTVRQAWAGAGSEPRGTENMIFNAFRYYVP